MRIPLLAPDNYAFPDPAYALARCDGLVGVSRDLDAGGCSRRIGTACFLGFRGTVGFFGMRSGRVR